MHSRLPDPRLNLIYRLEAAVGDPQAVDKISPGHRRIVPLTGETFGGPELRGTLRPGASADCKSFSRMALLSATSAPRWNEKICSLFNQEVCATEAWWSRASGTRAHACRGAVGRRSE